MSLILFLLEIAEEILGESILATAWDAICSALGLGHQERNATVVVFNWAMVGLLSAVLSVAIAPRPLLTPRGPQGLSLVLAPVVTACLMNFLGNYRRRKGHETTTVATFWGGWAFALSFSFLRL